MHGVDARPAKGAFRFRAWGVLGKSSGFIQKSTYSPHLFERGLYQLACSSVAGISLT